MQTNYFFRPATLVMGLAFLFLSNSYAAFAQGVIRGKVTDAKGEAIVGASAVLKGTTKGTSTNVDGIFTIENLSNGNYTVVISSIGFTTREVRANVPGSENLTIRLEETASNLNEVIVTGVFDKRERMDASIAISTLSAREIAQQVPVSASDLLKNVPGVFVNAARGEVNNQVYSRGVSAGGTNSGGYYYVSMQEDGLPVTNVQFNGGFFGPDFFLRADATLGRLEAVRGGSAAITGPNAPGGIFNYVSKVGSPDFSGEVRTKFGLEGNAQPFYRADVNLGGKLNEKGDLTYNVGGFYRYANGARYVGYPLNKGGQGKFNVVKTYKSGSLKLYAKYLDDRNGVFEQLPATNFNNPQVAPGLKNTDSFSTNKSLVFDYPVNSPTTLDRYNPANLYRSVDRAIGLDWNHTLGRGWSFQNNVKYSSKRQESDGIAFTSPVALTSLYPYVLLGGLGTFGTYSFKDHLTGRTLASVTQAPNIVGGQFAGFNFIPGATADLPGQTIQANSVLLSLLAKGTINVREVIDQASLTKKFNDKLSATVGTYIGISHIESFGGTAGATLSTIENGPHQLDVSAVGFDGKSYQFTNPQGVASLGGTGGGFNTSDFRQKQLSGFASLTWKLIPKLVFDGGLRYDNVNINGTTLVSVTNPARATPGYGGADGNPLTVYDNIFGVAGAAPLAVTKTIETVSYSGALNYRWAQDLSLYIRYSDGRKAPDLGSFIGLNTDAALASVNVSPQRVQQLEAGIKVQRAKYNVFATPFYSLLSNIRVTAPGINPDNTTYNTPALLNSVETYGLELESNYSLTDHLSFRAAITAQKSTTNKWAFWNTGAPGPQDDVVVDVSGNRAELVPNLMINFGPTYTIDKFTLFGNYRYMGSRAANVINAFELPAYSQFDAGFTYNLTKALSLQGNVNNVFNSIGVMGWAPPGGFPAAIDPQGFTPAKREADPNAAYSILSVQPRSYYLTAVFKF